MAYGTRYSIYVYCYYDWSVQMIPIIAIIRFFTVLRRSFQCMPLSLFLSHTHTHTFCLFVCASATRWPYVSKIPIAKDLVIYSFDKRVLSFSLQSIDLRSMRIWMAIMHGYVCMRTKSNEINECECECNACTFCTLL